MNLADILKQRQKKETIWEKLSSWWSYNKTYKIEIPFYDFKNGIKNIIHWWKVVWSDTDFDYHCIMKVWKFKLDKMSEEFIIKYKKAQKIGSCYYDDLPEKVFWMKIASNLITKLYSSDFNNSTYEDEWHKYHEKSFYWTPADDNDSLEEAKIVAQSLNRDMKINSIFEDDFEYQEIDLNDKIKLDIEDIEANKPYHLNSDIISDNLDEYFNQNKLLYKKAIATRGSNRESIAMEIGRLKHEKAKKLLFKILEEKIETWID